MTFVAHTQHTLTIDSIDVFSHRTPGISATFAGPRFLLSIFQQAFSLLCTFLRSIVSERSKEAATIRLDGLKLIKIWNNFFRMRHSLIHTKMNFRLRFFHLIVRCPFPVPLMEAFQWLFCVSVLSVY